MGRTRYLIAYDIAEHKRLYRIHKKVEAYAIGGQKSFYECWLTALELLELKKAVSAIMDSHEDRVFIFQLFNDTEPLLFGKAKLQSTRPFLFV